MTIAVNGSGNSGNNEGIKMVMVAIVVMEATMEKVVDSEKCISQ